MIDQHKIWTYNHRMGVDTDYQLQNLDVALIQLDHALQNDDEDAMEEAIGDVGFYLRSLAETQDIDVSPAINDSIEEHLEDVD